MRIKNTGTWKVGMVTSAGKGELEGYSYFEAYITIMSHHQLNISVNASSTTMSRVIPSYHPMSCHSVPCRSHLQQQPQLLGKQSGKHVLVARTL